MEEKEMPNHVANILNFHGKPEDIRDVKDLIKGVYDGASTRFDFNRIIPMPESLAIESGSHTDDALEYYMAMTYGRYLYEYREKAKEVINRCEEKYKDSLDELLKLGETAKNNIDQYGNKDWYGWRIDNWGTKWNAYDIEETDSCIRFDTAWSFPEPIIRKLAEIAIAHRVTISGIWADEDCGNNAGSFYSAGDGIDNLTVDICCYDDGSSDAWKAYIVTHGENDCIGKNADGEYFHYDCETCPHKCY